MQPSHVMAYVKDWKWRPPKSFPNFRKFDATKCLFDWVCQGDVQGLFKTWGKQCVMSNLDRSWALMNVVIDDWKSCQTMACQLLTTFAPLSGVQVAWFCWEIILKRARRKKKIKALMSAPRTLESRINSQERYAIFSRYHSHYTRRCRCPRGLLSELRRHSDMHRSTVCLRAEWEARYSSSILPLVRKWGIGGHNSYWLSMRTNFPRWMSTCTAILNFVCREPALATCGAGVFFSYLSGLIELYWKYIFSN